MKIKAESFQFIFIFAFCLLFGSADTFTNDPLPLSTQNLTSQLSDLIDGLATKSQIEEIKISAETIATINEGDFVYPAFSPDGKQIAYSKVLIEDTKSGKMENSEIHIYDLQKHTKFVLLNAKQARKYAVYASFVSNLEWVGVNRLRAYVSDGDVDSTILTFDTQNRRMIKKEYSGDSDEEIDTEEVYPDAMKPIYLSMIKTFPEIPKEVVITAFHRQQAFKIGNQGAVLQFAHGKIDSNIWFFDFQTKKKQLLLEVPNDKGFNLIGAFKTSAAVLFFVEDKGETVFYVYQNGKVSQHLKTTFGGGFQPLLSSSKKTIFLLKQPNYEDKLQSSLWLFDENKLKRVTDVENLNDVNIDSSRKLIAFCYAAENKERNISVKKLKIDF